MQAAIITADIAGSSQIPALELETRTKALAKELEGVLFRNKRTFEFYRGDSFQALIKKPEDALKIALLWRTGIMATEPGGWDIRLAIGIGDIEHLGQKLSTSGGPAFQYSGTLLDALKKSDNQRLGFSTFSESWNRRLEMECILAEGIMRRWTTSAADAVYNQLLYGETQEQLSQRLGIAQPAVHKRLQTANWPAIRYWENYYRHETLSLLTKQA